MLLLSLTALPWVSAGGEEATFSDIRDAFDAVDDLDGGESFDPPDITTPTVGRSAGQGGGSPAGPVPVSSFGVRQQEPPAAGSSETEFVEIYAEALWMAVVGAAVIAVVFATGIVPSSKGGRLLTGFLMAGVLGLAVNAADDDGSVGPRVSGALVALLCLGVHGYAVFDLFGDELAPDPAWGVWAGVAGLVLVLIGCVMGTRTERVPAYR